MHIHNVYFWLKSDVSDQDMVAFEQGLAALAGDPSVKAGYYGKPADTQRDVIENSYTYGMVLVFANLAGHDQYQTGAAHLQFLDNHLTKWEKVVVHDIEIE